MLILARVLADLGIARLDRRRPGRLSGHPRLPGPGAERGDGRTRRAALGRVIEAMMVRKSEAEIALIRESARWCEHAHRLLQEYTRPGVTEAEASLRAGPRGDARDAARARRPLRRPAGLADGASAGYRGQIGLRSSWAHAVAHNIEFQPGDVLVTETAAPIWGYNAELERAMVIGPPSDEQRRLFDHTVAAQQAAFDALRPGVTCADVDGAVMRYLEENDMLPLLAPAHRPRDRPPQPRGAVPRPRRPHADRARHGVHDRAGRLRRRARRLPPLRHRRGHHDGIEILTDYPRDIESLTLPV